MNKPELPNNVQDIFIHYPDGFEVPYSCVWYSNEAVKEEWAKTHGPEKDVKAFRHKLQMTQQGWDGQFTGVKIPSPTTMDGDDQGSQTQDWTQRDNDYPGFNRPNE